MNPNILRALLIAQSRQNPVFNSPSQYDYNMDYFNRFGGQTGPGVGGLHYTDWWKKPTHETFSNESLLAAESPQLAGKWLAGLDGRTYGYLPSFQGMQPYQGFGHGKQPKLEIAPISLSLIDGQPYY